MATINRSSILGAGSRVLIPWLLALCLSTPAFPQFSMGGSRSTGGAGYRGRNRTTQPQDPSSLPFDPRSDPETWDSRFVADIAWTKTISSHPSAGPVVVKETILVPFKDRTVRGFGSQDGTESFRLPIEADPVGGLVVFDDDVLLATLQGDLLMIDVAKGRTIFRAHLPEELRLQPVATRQGILVTTGSDQLYLLANRTGKIIWKRKAPGKGTLSPVPTSDQTGIVVCSEDGTLALLSLKDGATAWKTMLSRGASARPAISEDRIFIPTADRFLHAVDLDDGDERWSHRLGGVATIPPLLATEAGKTRVIVVTRDNVIQSVRASNGFREWRKKLPAPVADPVAIRGGVAYATVESGTNVLGFMLKNGYQLGTVPIGLSSGQGSTATVAPNDYLVGAAAFHQHRVFLASYGGRLVASKIITSAAIEDGTEKFPERLRTPTMTSTPGASAPGTAIP